jgi:organic hydroperoxide reductase OsmC/OhrA
MSEHAVTLQWKREKEFTYQSYNRDHSWKLDGGAEITASAAPGYLGNPSYIDPEEAYIASLASCHMLTFLAVACKKKFVIDSYSDAAIGTLEKNPEGKMAITRLVLRPKVVFGGDRQPNSDELHELHDFAHRECFIANSVKTQIAVEPARH